MEVTTRPSQCLGDGPDVVTLKDTSEWRHANCSMLPNVLHVKDIKNDLAFTTGNYPIPPLNWCDVCCNFNDELEEVCKE